MASHACSRRNQLPAPPRVVQNTETVPRLPSLALIPPRLHVTLHPFSPEQTAASRRGSPGLGTPRSLAVQGPSGGSSRSRGVPSVGTAGYLEVGLEVLVLARQLEEHRVVEELVAPYARSVPLVA
eukprot:3940676-Rhodomonas_salina.2